MNLKLGIGSVSGIGLNLGNRYQGIGIGMNLGYRYRYGSSTR